MKKALLLNQPVSSVIAGLGHTDTLVIADAGLPIPRETMRIDLALKAGVPGFIETLSTVLSEMQVESALIAQEMMEVSPHLYHALQEVLGDVPIGIIPHENLKELTREARAVIRTGEFTPYANIILVSGVTF